MNNAEELKREGEFIKQRREENEAASDGLADGLTQKTANKLLKTRGTIQIF